LKFHPQPAPDKSFPQILSAFFTLWPLSFALPLQITRC
jgi:hypothetical protein